MKDHPDPRGHFLALRHGHQGRNHLRDVPDLVLVEEVDYRGKAPEAEKDVFVFRGREQWKIFPENIFWAIRNLRWHCTMAIKDEDDAEVKASEFKDEDDAEVKASEFKNHEDEVDDEKALKYKDNCEGAKIQ